MKAGIIAAGVGERIRAGGIATPKPLLKVGGMTLISRTITAARRAGATEVACIVNAETNLVFDYLQSTDFGIEVKVIQKSTQSSAESFVCLKPLLQGSPFILFTVDSVFDPACLNALVTAGSASTVDGALALTTFINDEKPLFARVDESWRITRLGSQAAGSPYVTAGIYFFSPLVYELINVSDLEQLSAFRQLLQMLLSRGFRFRGYLVPMAIDVDRPEDITEAEEFLRALRREDQ